MRDLRELRRRIEELEHRLKVGAITLVMPDGTRHTITGSLDQWLALLDASKPGAEPSPEVAERLEWLMNAEKIVEEDGRLFEFLAAIAGSPRDDEGAE